MSNGNQSLQRIRWAVRATLAFAVGASVAANILHADRNPISEAIAAWPPLALLLTGTIVEEPERPLCVLQSRQCGQAHHLVDGSAAGQRGGGELENFLAAAVDRRDAKGRGVIVAEGIPILDVMEVRLDVRPEGCGKLII